MNSPVDQPMLFLPGPTVQCSKAKKAFLKQPISHRSEEFRRLYARLRERLLALANAQELAILAGSGTAANDAVALQLRQMSAKGLVLTNGEFGDRLVDHALRAEMEHAVYREAPGARFDPEALDRFITASESRFGWLWAVHCETSTGVLNDIDAIISIAKRHQLVLALDCVSTLGTLPFNLGEVDFATSVSGKGIASYPGLAFVFYKTIFLDQAPARSLDLKRFADNNGIPYTLSSNFLDALLVTLEEINYPARYESLEEKSGWLRDQLQALGFTTLAHPDHASPGVVTVCLPATLRTQDLGQQLEHEGYMLYYQSEYLVDQNYIQIGLMSDNAWLEIIGLIAALERYFEGVTR